MVERRARSRPFVVLVAAAAIAVGACDAAPRPAETQAAPNATSASQSPTDAPSPTPLDVAAAFKTAFAGIKSGVMDLSGQATIGAVQLTIAGSTTFSGLDSSDVTTTTISGVPSQVSHVQTGGKRYVKTGAGPWLDDTSVAPANNLSKELARVAAVVTDSGVESHRGTPAHKLLPPPGTTFDPAALGLAAAGATGVQVSVVFYAKDDGTPVAVTIDASWSQGSGASTAAVAMNLDITLSQLGVPHVIRAPDDVWVYFKSKRFGFRFAHPGDYDYFKAKYYDEFTGPASQFVAAGRQAKFAGETLNSLTTFFIGLDKKDFHAKTVKNTATTLAGEKARFLSLSGTDSKKHKIVLYEVVCLRGKYVYDIYWISYAGSEATDLLTFQALIATFRFS
jgi:hypothetical protein